MSEALEQALKFIERVNMDGWILADFEPEMYQAITAIKEALAQPESEQPVGQLCEDALGRGQVVWFEKVVDGSMLYASPLATVAQPSREEILGAVARGWCHEKNEMKTMDSDLAIAIADEILAMQPAQRPWVGLTDEELDEIYAGGGGTRTRRAIVRLIEAKLKGKNT